MNFIISTNEMDLEKTPFSANSSCTCSIRVNVFLFNRRPGSLYSTMISNGIEPPKCSEMKLMSSRIGSPSGKSPVKLPVASTLYNPTKLKAIKMAVTVYTNGRLCVAKRIKRSTKIPVYLFCKCFK